MMFDPDKKKVDLFITRIHSMAQTFGDEAVRLVLPLCLEGEATEWYCSLSKTT